jgi:glycosyltransferase involved in cell wall biosynthesis
MPKVSIIMPVYNGARYLKQSVESLFKQTYADFEIIAVDDGSTDNSLDILHDLSHRDKRLVVRSRTNSGGPAAPKNDGLAAACGEYVGFLDCDDYSRPEHIQRLVEALDSRPEWVAAFHDLEYVDANGMSLPDTYLGKARFHEKASSYITQIDGGWFDCGPRYFEFMCLHHDGMHTDSVLIARGRTVGVELSFDTAYVIGEDVDLWLRVGRMGRIGYLDQVLGSYRLHEGGITRQMRLGAQLVSEVHAKNFAVAEKLLKSDALECYRKKIASHYAMAARISYLDERHREAFEWYSRALHWKSSRSIYTERLKTLLPPGLMGWIRQIRGN